MANEEHLRRLKQGVAAWNLWREERPDKDRQPDLSRADLSEEHLSEEHLFGANLSGSLLYGVDFSKANLSTGNLQGALLIGADLRGADLTEAKLQGARLEDALYDDHTKWPEDINLEAIDATFVSEAEAPPATFRELAETFTAYVGIPALLLYPLGLFMLALQLYRNYGMNFLTAWYASSLVPNTVVAGHGAKTFLIPLVISLVVSSVVAYLMSNRVFKIVSSVLGLIRRLVRGNPRVFSWTARFNRIVSSALGLIRRLVGGLSRVFLWTTPVLVLVALLYIVLYVVADASNYTNIFAVPWSVAVSMVGGFFIYHNHQKSRYRNRKMRLSRGVAEGWILGGLAIAYLGGLVGAFAVVYTESEVLPRVSMNIERGANEAPSANRQLPDSVDGALLLSHSDGNWYILCEDSTSTKTDSDSTSTCKGPKGPTYAEESAAIYPGGYRYLSSRNSSTEDERPGRTGEGPIFFGMISRETIETIEEEATVAATGESIDATAKRSTETTIEESTEPTDEKTLEQSGQAETEGSQEVSWWTWLRSWFEGRDETKDSQEDTEKSSQDDAEQTDEKTLDSPEKTDSADKELNRTQTDILAVPDEAAKNVRVRR